MVHLFHHGDTEGTEKNYLLSARETTSGQKAQALRAGNKIVSGAMLLLAYNQKIGCHAIAAKRLISFPRAEACPAGQRGSRPGKNILLRDLCASSKAGGSSFSPRRHGGHREKLSFVRSGDDKRTKISSPAGRQQNSFRRYAITRIQSENRLPCYCREAADFFSSGGSLSRWVAGLPPGEKNIILSVFSVSLW